MSREIASDEQIKHWARQLSGGKPTYGQLQEELSASQAREAALREKLEAAEARIKASQEQEPFDYVYRGTEPVPTFLQPPIPPELAELQRENAELRKLLESKVPSPAVSIWDGSVKLGAPQPKEPKQ